MTPGRLPYEPLERFLQLSWGTPRAMRGPQGHADHGLFTDKRAGQLIGVTSRTVSNYRRHGLTPLEADRAAIAAGLHPLLVWRKAWLAAEIGTDLRRRERAA